MQVSIKLLRGTPIFVLPLWAAMSCGEPPAPAAPVAATDPFQASMDSINARIVQEPAKAAHYQARAHFLLQVDSLAAAQRDLERAVKLDSTNVLYRLELGDLCYRTVQVDKALSQFEQAARIDPSSTPAILKQAEIQLVLRKYNESMNLVNDALRKDQHAAHGYFLKGWIYMETGDTALALSSFRTAVEQDPADYSAYIMLGKISAARRDPLAEQYYATAIALRPRSVEAWYNKGIFLQENGKDSAALACYDTIKVIAPDNALAWFNSGWVRLEHLHDPSTAEHDFSEAIRLEPGYTNAWYNRGLARERSGQLDSAAADYSKAIGQDPGHDLAARGLDRLQSKGVRIDLGKTRR